MSWNLHIHCLLAISLLMSAALELGLEPGGAGKGLRAAASDSIRGGHGQ